MIKSGYCSITVANYDGTLLIRFVSKNYTHPQKDFANKLHLVHHACIRLFLKKNSRSHPNTALVYSVLVTFFFTVLCSPISCAWPYRKNRMETEDSSSCNTNKLWSLSSQHGSVYKLAFGPKSFVVVSDPIVARHILRENAFCYDKVWRLTYSIGSISIRNSRWLSTIISWLPWCLPGYL